MAIFHLPETYKTQKQRNKVYGGVLFIDGKATVKDEDAQKKAKILCRYYNCTVTDYSPIQPVVFQEPKVVPQPSVEEVEKPTIDDDDDDDEDDDEDED